MTSSDVLVIGGGHNGLACAALLARSGRRVVLVEAETELGGAARTHEFHPGFKASLAHLLNRLHPEVIAALELERHGLRLADGGAAPTTILSGGAPLMLKGAYGETLAGDIASGETAAWARVRAQLIRYAGVLKPMLTHAPPSLVGMSWRETLSLGSVALSLRRLGKDDMRDFLRVLLMNVADFADDELSDERLKALLAFDATLGMHLGPRSPTSLLGMLYRLSGEAAGRPGGQAFAMGGMGAVADAMRAAASAAGVDFRTGVGVVRIRVEKGRATGVVLANGEEIAARTIVSAINPATTLMSLVGPREIDTGVVRKAQNIRMKGNAAKLHLALDAVPAFTGVGNEALRGRLVIARSVNHVEEAFNPAKYGAFSADPVMEITLPSVADPSLAPAGGAVLSAVVQYAPYALREGWEAGKPKLLAAVMAALERHAPGIGGLVRHAELLTPLDIEQRYRMPGGHWHHGELQADQMLMSRPFFGVEDYTTPIDGLWLAGSGSHPGGGVSGVPGLNAARRIVGRGR